MPRSTTVGLPTVVLNRGTLSRGATDYTRTVRAMAKPDRSMNVPSHVLPPYQYTSLPNVIRHLRTGVTQPFPRDLWRRFPSPTHDQSQVNMIWWVNPNSVLQVDT